MMNKMESLKNRLAEVKFLKKLKLGFDELSKDNKIQAIIASALTVILLIALPVFAWFAFAGKIEAFTKIKEPDNLDIRAGHYDAVQYFSLNDIDIEKIKDGTHHMVVFSVNAGDYKIPYQLQLAHTTNIPFKYQIFRATEYVAGADNAPANPAVTYVSIPARDRGETDYTYLYVKGTEITLTAKNPDTADTGIYGRILALGSDTYYNHTYANGDNPEIYAVPIYEQSGEIRYDQNSEHDYFILEISWDSTAAQTGNFLEWNEAKNKKETDMIYLTASRYSG